MAETLEATFRIVTPMFIGDAHQAPEDGVRPPSVKGALRFWWRALNWRRMRDKVSCDEAALHFLRAEECRLFGATAEQGGQGCFLLHTRTDAETGAPVPVNPGHQYLLGQGLYRPEPGISRQALLAGGSFVINVHFKPHTLPQDVDQVSTALKLFGLLGGLGSRERRGLGSVAISGLKVNGEAVSVPDSADSYKSLLLQLLPAPGVAQPPFTAFSRLSRIDISDTGTDAWRLLNSLGDNFMRYRSWGLFVPGVGGNPGQHEAPRGLKAEQNFPTDHHAMLAAVQGTPPAALPDRSIFGLPHNYFFKSEFETLTKSKTAQLVAQGVAQDDAATRARKWARAQATVQLLPTAKGRQRRASPLLIHIHQLTPNQFLGVQTFLPAAFLPPADRVGISATRLITPCALAATPNPSFVHNYLNRFNAGRGKFYG